MSFFIAILIGGGILSLPFVTLNGKGTDLIEGIFTATSAVCVTGLTVNDVSTTYNLIGKTIILVLIQLGGIGLITFSSLLILLISKEISYYTKKVVQEDINAETVFNIQKYVKKVIVTVLLIELIGAAILFFEFIKKFEFLKAIYYSVFHSVSAFCNAGFSLFSDNLESFKGSVIINTVIPILIMVGGLGFSTIINVYKYLRKEDKRITTTSKITLKVTLGFVVFGAFFIFIFEHANVKTIGNYTFIEKIGAAFFQSVTTRTAGFNTMPLAGMKEITALLFIFFMFIGASPGSTGGGIKTTTFGLIVLGVITIIKNEEYIEYNGRKISWTNFNRAISIVFISVCYIVTNLFLLILLEPDVNVINLLFELVSAFGTAGVTRNLTPYLGNMSKILLIVTMFIGRVGPLTIVSALSLKKIKSGKHKYPEENILIG
jgi:potassium uptake protein, trkH family